MKKVLLAIGNMGGGGAERVLSILAGAFSRRGLQVCLCCIDGNDIPDAYPLAPEIEVVRLRQQANTRLGRLRALRRLLRTWCPDTAVVFMAHNAVQVLAAAAGLGVPVVYSIRNVAQNEVAFPLLKLATRLLFPFARGAVYQTSEQQAFWKPAPRRTDVIIPNPVMPSPLWDVPKPDGSCEVVAVGRLEDAKNFPLLLRAFATAAADKPDWRLSILGEGSQREPLEALVCKLGLKGRVSLPGFVDDPASWLHRADIFVMSSDYEGQPNALLEALCMGTACASTNFAGGAAAQLITDGENGLLVPPGDETALCSALGRLMGDETLRRRLGKAATALRESLSETHVTSRWLALLESLAAEKGAAKR